jgi:transformation/transcription domain-associated protein
LNLFNNAIHHQPGQHPLVAASPRPMSPAADFTETPSKMLAKSLYSFKVLTECPIIVVLLFQSYRKFAADNIVKFVPLIIEVNISASSICLVIAC